MGPIPRHHSRALPDGSSGARPQSLGPVLGQRPCSSAGMARGASSDRGLLTSYGAGSMRSSEWHQWWSRHRFPSLSLSHSSCFCAATM